MSLQRFTIIQCSDFNILNRFSAGEDIAPILSQRQEIGFNCLRVWTAYSIDRIGRLVPHERPNLYDCIPEFLQHAANHNLYVEFTAGTGPWLGIFNNEDEKIIHWNNLVSAVRGHSNASLEMINEADNGPNKPWPIDRCVRPNDILSSHGSNIIDNDPVEPVWDIAGFHPGPDPRKVGHNAMERADKFRIPIWSGETVRYPDNNSSPRNARDAARAAALLCAGSCFHSVRGKTSELWDGIEEICARAWVGGAKEVPLEFQAGAYRHRTDLESATIVRAYDRILPDGRAFAVTIEA